MRSLLMATLVCGLAMLTGCAQIAGTWKLAPGQSKGTVSFGSMTLANDGTFTAEANYGDHTRVVSGFYKFCTLGCRGAGCSACKKCAPGCTKDCCAKKCKAGCKKACCAGKAGCLSFESDGKKRTYKARLAGDTLRITHKGESVTMNRLRR